MNFEAFQYRLVKTLRRSGGAKGGFTTKIHLLTNSHGLPRKVEVTPGQVSDYKGYDAVMDNDLPQPRC